MNLDRRDVLGGVAIEDVESHALLNVLSSANKHLHRLSTTLTISLIIIVKPIPDYRINADLYPKANRQEWCVVEPAHTMWRVWLGCRAH